MDISLSERRQIENEMIFRRSNEVVGEELEQIDAKLRDDGHAELTRSDDMVLHFLCECSDENCDERIPITLRAYQKIHENRDAFIIKPNHQVIAIEKVIHTEDGYSVVEKNNAVTNPGDTLHETSVDNS